MEETSGRSANPVGFVRRGSGISLRNQSNEERPTQYSNKPGKTTNLNPMKARWADNKEKPRYLQEPFRSSGSKASSPSSSKAPVRKHYEEKQKLPFLARVDHAESSNRRTEVRSLQSGKKAVVYEDEHSYTQQTGSEGSSSITTTEGGLPEEPDLEVEASVPSGISAHTVDYIVRNTASSTMSRRQKDKEESSSGRPQGASTFVRRPTVPQSSTIGIKSSNSAGTGVKRHGLKNLGCTSISDVLPSACSSSDSVHNRRAEVTKKRTSDGESFSRSRGISGQASLGHTPAIYPGITGPRARAAEQSASQQTARTSGRSIQDSVDSVRTTRPSTQRTRERMLGEREDAIVALHETVTRVRHPERGHFPTDDVSPQRLARPFYAGLPHAIYSSNHQGSTRARRRPSPSPEESPPQMFHGLFGERDGYRRINMEGIAEVLLALDRIEQDDEFSYEELLALEEQIGSVSTAISEEQFTKCVNRSVYKARNSEREVNKIVVDDVKCSICQEEYIEGENIGRMQCEHQYHVCCIHEWLRQKNWCPICKASAIPSETNKGDASI
ncbi:E3 ubiquitin-protein ligase MBR1-like isoform X2 [Phragmites australis]|uniref:E3 ubiquitin-protein ligase MBR1-like isoform X2 n=1 Tax=Phragmites australis TaxID=29695 RepID=UPI002D787005|nr:E3 ubiquitin-protein ligase MBR1-like isoform X2 [Phragmites australis]